MYHELRTCDVNRYMILPKIIKKYDFNYTAANDVCAADPPPLKKREREKKISDDVLFKWRKRKS